MANSGDSIEGSGLPLAFKVREATSAPAARAGVPGEDLWRVEARAFSVDAAGGGHQKEAVVTEGNAGAVWRLTSDEGPGLGGTDLAPFPLGFFNAALQADLAGRVVRAAQDAGVPLTAVDTRCDNLYWSEGSFFQGTGGGFAAAPVLALAIQANASPASIAAIIRAAVAASPMLALVRTPLANTFALYVNGRRVPVTSMPASTAADAMDPLKSYRGAPQPLAGVPASAPAIEKLFVDPTGVAPRKPLPAAGRVDIHVNGTGAVTDRRGLTRSEVWLPLSPLSRFALRSDESADGSTAPSGLALGLAGIAFCYMTQLLRYTEYRKYNVRAVRMVQLSPVAMIAGSEGAPHAAVRPIETHLFLHGDEPDEVMQALLALGATRCYLHSTIGPALTPVITVTLNGEAVNLAA